MIHGVIFRVSEWRLQFNEDQETQLKEPGSKKRDAAEVDGLTGDQDEEEEENHATEQMTQLFAQAGCQASDGEDEIEVQVEKNGEDQEETDEESDEQPLLRRSARRRSAPENNEGRVENDAQDQNE